MQGQHPAERHTRLQQAGKQVSGTPLSVIVRQRAC
jgi:formiminotetrahydrofolate cyclodeaminase